MSFRDRFFTPRVARAVTSPSAILALGLGAALGVLFGGSNPVLWAVALGLVAYGIRVLAAVPGERPGRAGAIAPRSLDSPWREAVEQVQNSRRDFEEATSSVAEGPLKERLDGVATRLDDAVLEAWRIASAGNVLSRGRKQIDTTRIESELAYERSRPQGSTTAATIAAMEAQLASAERLDATIRDTHDRLVLLDARTDEVVTRAVELSVSQVDEQVVGELDSDVGRIVGDLEALRLAIEETHGSSATDARMHRFGGTSQGGAG